MVNDFGRDKNQSSAVREAGGRFDGGSSVIREAGRRRGGGSSAVREAGGEREIGREGGREEERREEVVYKKQVRKYLDLCQGDCGCIIPLLHINMILWFLFLLNIKFAEISSPLLLCFQEIGHRQSRRLCAAMNTKSDRSG